MDAALMLSEELARMGFRETAADHLGDEPDSPAFTIYERAGDRRMVWVLDDHLLIFADKDDHLSGARKVRVVSENSWFRAEERHGYRWVRLDSYRDRGAALRAVLAG